MGRPCYLTVLSFKLNDETKVIIVEQNSVITAQLMNNSICIQMTVQNADYYVYVCS